MRGMETKWRRLGGVARAARRRVFGAWRLRDKQAHEHETQQLCKVHRPISLDKLLLT